SRSGTPRTSAKGHHHDVSLAFAPCMSPQPALASPQGRVVVTIHRAKTGPDPCKCLILLAPLAGALAARPIQAASPPTPGRELAQLRGDAAAAVRQCAVSAHDRRLSLT